MSAEELTDGFPCRSHGPMFTQGNEYELISITSLLGPRAVSPSTLITAERSFSSCLAAAPELGD